ncbi:MAG: hypothetical protein ACRDZR_10575 [Acidimicrobiales bacterium]
MVVTAVAPDAVGAFTWDDLQHAPDDSLRRELVAGQLLVTPSPADRHQRAVRRLCVVLDLPHRPLHRYAAAGGGGGGGPLAVDGGHRPDAAKREQYAQHGAASY